MQKYAKWLMASVTLVWGFANVLMKFGIKSLPPAEFIFLRFGIAFFVTALIFRKKVFCASKREIWYSVILGLLLFLNFYSILHALQITTATAVGFLMCFNIVYITIIECVIEKKWPTSKEWIGGACALLGVGLISISGKMTVDLGAVFCMACSLLYSIQVVITKRFIVTCSALNLGIWQLGFAAVFAFFTSLMTEDIVTDMPLESMGIVIALALVCTSYGFVMQTCVQKYISPETIGLIYMLEPVFSAVLAFLFLGENLSLKEYVGSLLIVFAIIYESDTRKSHIQKGKQV